MVIAVMLSGAATASAIAPNEVCIYEHEDFIGAARCLKLEFGMRQRLVPTLAC
jgi:hypothetical protein